MKRRGCVLLWMVAVLLLCRPVSGQTAEAPAHLLLVKAAAALNVATGQWIRPAEVLVEGERIRQIGTHVAAPPGTETVDLGPLTLLPVMIV
jgi:imidazolonepropionase-like amidohydrolase